MAFQKKAPMPHVDRRDTKFSALKEREHKVQALKAANNPEARKVLKQMNDKVYRGSRSNLTDWYAPNGVKINAKYKPHKAGK